MTTTAESHITQVINNEVRITSVDENFGVLDYLFNIFVKDE